MARKVQTLVATSSDPRYQETIQKWVVSQKLSDKHVRIALAGCVKDRESLMKNIRAAHAQWSVTDLYLISSEGDPAYADRKFADAESEFEAHCNDLRNTQAAIHAELPDLTSNILFITKKQEVKKIPNA